MNSFKKFSKDMKPFFNHLGIVHDNEIVRLIGVAHDPYDFYYVCVSRRGKIMWYTAVGAFVSIENSYERIMQLDNIFCLNGGIKADAWIEEYDETEYELLEIVRADK